MANHLELRPDAAVRADFRETCRELLNAIDHLRRAVELLGEMHEDRPDCERCRIDRGEARTP